MAYFWHYQVKTCHPDFVETKMKGLIYMFQLEIIRIRLFSLSDADQVTILFQQVKDKLEKIHDESMIISLLKNRNVENDWAVHLTHLKDPASKEVANLTILLTETFRTIGMVNRDMWEPFC